MPRSHGLPSRSLSLASLAIVISVCAASPDRVAAQLLPCSVETIFTSDEGWADRGLGESVAVSGDVAIVGSPFAGCGRIHLLRNQNGTWVREQEFDAPGTTDEERFGWSVDIDGDVAVVGAPRHTTCGGASLCSGRVVVLRFDSVTATWETEQVLFSSSISPGEFGDVVTIDGNRIAVADQDDTMGAGRVYLFEYDAVSGQWLAEQTLIPSASVQFEFFGRSISLVGDRIAVGMPSRSAGGGNDGATALFERDATSGVWSEVVILTAPILNPSANFGAAVALSPSQLAVGSPGEDPEGVVYVFEPDLSGAWTLVQTIVSTPDFGRIGRVLRFEGTRLALGDPTEAFDAGAIHLYQFDALSGQYVFEETVRQDPPVNNSEFGHTFAFAGSEIFVGSPRDSQTEAGRGVAEFLAPAVGGGWETTQTFLPLDRAGNDEFGEAVAIDGDRMVVGSPWDSDTNESRVGTATTYVRSGGQWIAEQVLIPNTVPPADRFGLAVALSGDRLAVLRESWAGSVHVYTRNGTNTGWDLEQILPAEPGVSFNSGNVWIEGDDLLVGAPVSLTGSGAVSHYSFDAQSGTWSFVSGLVGTPGSSDRTGSSIAVQGTNLFVGSTQFGGLARVERYEWQGGIGALLQTISGAAPGDRFGAALAAEDDLLVIGAIRGGAGAFGSVEIFREGPTGDYAFEQQLAADSSLPSLAQFGSSLDLEGDLIVVGAWLDDAVQVDSGAVYIYRRASGTDPWNRLGTLLSPASGAEHHFGKAVALEGGLLVVGEPWNGVPCGACTGCRAGAFHTFDLDSCGVLTFEGFVRGDASGDGLIQINDAIVGLTALFGGASLACRDAADTNDDGAIDLADPISVLGFLFGGSQDPPSPFPTCGNDPTADALDCVFFGGC